jgi:hypothetical protein
MKAKTLEVETRVDNNGCVHLPSLDIPINLPEGKVRLRVTIEPLASSTSLENRGDAEAIESLPAELKEALKEAPNAHLAQFFGKVKEKIPPLEWQKQIRGEWE